MANLDAEYHPPFGGRYCPECDSGDTERVGQPTREYGDRDEMSFYQDVECHECGYRWVEVYHLAYRYHKGE